MYTPGMRFLWQLLSLLLDSIFPPFCCHCQWPFSFLCQRCYQEIDFLPLTPHLKLEPNYLDQVILGGYFDGPLKSLILSLKYDGQIEVATTLAHLLHHTIHIPSVDLITWVPAHTQRLKDRGYNQAQLIAQALATIKSIPSTATLVRTTHLTAQADIHDRSERLTRQTHTMEIVPESQILRQIVLVIDDVFTTGATLNEAARVLKNHGAKTVVGLAVGHGG